MTVKELIEILSKFSPDEKIVVSGYEDGFDDIVSVDKELIVANPDHANWEGFYREAEGEESQVFEAIHIA